MQQLNDATSNLPKTHWQTVNLKNVYLDKNLLAEKDFFFVFSVALSGVTKNTQEVQLDSKIKLLDSPGMILASGSMSDASIALRNAIKVSHFMNLRFGRNLDKILSYNM
jgi:ribosome biogenesis GTPase A